MPTDFYYIVGSPPCTAVLLTAKAVGIDLNLKLKEENRENIIKCLENITQVGISDDLEEDFNKMVKFVIRFYTNNENIHCINDLRGVLAFLKPISKLPPTIDNLKQHCLRVYYQTKIWLNSTIPKPSLSVLSDCEWKIVDGKLVPILTTVSILPENTPALNTCSCKKDWNGPHCEEEKNKFVALGPANVWLKLHVQIK